MAQAGPQSSATKLQPPCARVYPSADVIEGARNLILGLTKENFWKLTDNRQQVPTKWQVPTTFFQKIDQNFLNPHII